MALRLKEVLVLRIVRQILHERQLLLHGVVDSRLLRLARNLTGALHHCGMGDDLDTDSSEPSQGGIGFLKSEYRD